MTNIESIELDLKLYGIAYTVDGKRVDPISVVRYDRPKETANVPKEKTANGESTTDAAREPIET